MDPDRVTRPFSSAYASAHESLAAGFARRGEEQRRQDACRVLNRLIFACFVQDTDAWDDIRHVRRAISTSPDRNGQSGRGLNGKGRAPALSEAACRTLLDFARDWRWRLSDGPPANPDEVTPDVLGLILERHVNQRQTGSYYTRPDVTRYIAQATIIPGLIDAAASRSPDPLALESALRRRLMRDPVKYLHPAARRGALRDDGTLVPLPPHIAAGLDRVDRRDLWNDTADGVSALPDETWREVVERRERCLAIYESLRAGTFGSINDLVTWNIDLGRLLSDVLAASDQPLVDTVYEVLAGRPAKRGTVPAAAAFSIVDPTCGSGAFLVAAMDVLEPLYEVCLARRGPAVNGHTRRSAIRRTIVARNLYGVDLLPEAVEMCCLRLRLKIAAAERAEGTAKRAAETLRESPHNIHLGDALAGQPGDPRWCQQHSTGTNGSAFAWNSAFPRVLASNEGGGGGGGGFDVVLGNPPYIETPRVARNGQGGFDRYRVSRTGNLFALCTERSLELLRPGGRLGLILPMSAVATPRMRPLMELMCERLSPLWLSHFACRPDKLFAGADMNVTIVLGTRRTDHQAVAASGSPAAGGRHEDERRAARRHGGTPIYTTRYQRWSKRFRPFLFETLHYTPTELLAERGTVPRLSSEAERSLLRKLQGFAADGRLRAQSETAETETVYYHSGGRYFRKCLKRKLSNEYKPLAVPPGWGDAAMCLLSSSLFYWLWIVLSDCYHVTDRDLRYLPLTDSLQGDPELSTLAGRLIEDLWANSETRTRRRADGSQRREVNFDMACSKPLLDEIDHVLAKHFGLTEAERDHVLHYDARYRLESRSRAPRGTS